MIELCWLRKNGISLAEADSMSPGERLGMSVIFARFEGSDFDFEKGRWKKA